MEDTFRALRDLAPARGLRKFAVDDAVLVFVSLTFFPASQLSTFMVAVGRDLDVARVRRRHVKLVVGQLLPLLTV